MLVSVVYALPEEYHWLHIEVEEGTTVDAAIEQSGILEKCPEIDIATQKVGIYGKLSKPDTVLREGDRVEIYRKITADPKTVKRRASEDDDDDC